MVLAQHTSIISRPCFYRSSQFPKDSESRNFKKSLSSASKRDPKKPEKNRKHNQKKTADFLHFLPRCSHGATFFASLAWRRCPPLLDWLRWPSTPRAGCSGERHRRPRQRKRPVWCRCIKACPCCNRWEKHGKVGITRWFLVEYIYIIIHIQIILHTLYIYIL